MADRSHIEWTDATWNPITGCSIVSPGCTNCYAMRLAGARMAAHPSRTGLTSPSKAGPVWTGEVRLNEAWLAQPLRWAKPRRIFVCAHGDLFHPGVPDAWVDQVVAVMALTPHHTHQVLTKRAARMRAYFKNLPNRLHELATVMVDHSSGRRALGELIDLTVLAHPLPNLWLGVSAEDQPRLDERAPELLATPAAVRFLSAEPALGLMDLRGFLPQRATAGNRPWSTFRWPDWVPTEVRTEVEDFWQPSWGRGPDAWIRGALNNGHDPLGTRGSYRVLREAPPIEGRFVPAWNNIGRVVDDNGVAHVVSHGRYQRRPAYLDLVILGGESGPASRPMHEDWVSQPQAQCAAAGVAFFFKQWGDFLPEGQFDAEGLQWAPGNADSRVHWWKEVSAEGALPPGSCSIRIGKARAGRSLFGIEHNAMPAGQAA